jgi:hypothetical protein
MKRAMTRKDGNNNNGGSGGMGKDAAKQRFT